MSIPDQVTSGSQIRIQWPREGVGRRSSYSDSSREMPRKSSFLGVEVEGRTKKAHFVRCSLRQICCSFISWLWCCRIKRRKAAFFLFLARRVVKWRKGIQSPKVPKGRGMTALCIFLCWDCFGLLLWVKEISIKRGKETEPSSSFRKPLVQCLGADAE